MPTNWNEHGHTAASAVKRGAEANGIHTATNFVARKDGRVADGAVGFEGEEFRCTSRIAVCSPAYLMRTKVIVFFALLISVSGLAGAETCYTVYGSTNEMIFQSRTAPVAMNVPSVSAAVEKRFPGGSMLFRESATCFEVSPESIAKQRANRKAELAREKAEVRGRSATQPRLAVEQNAPNSQKTTDQHSANTPAYISTRGFSSIGQYEAARSACMRLMSQYDFTAPIMRCGLNDSNCFSHANNESSAIFGRMIAQPEWRQQQCDLILEMETAANNDESGCTQVQIMRPVPFLGTADEVIYLSDGSVWKDLSYKYLYLYAYNPAVLICHALSKMILNVGSQKHTFRLMRVR